MAFVTPVVEHLLEREIAQWVHPMKDLSDDPSHHEWTLYLWATSRSERTCSHKELFYVFNKFISFDWSQCLCTWSILQQLLERERERNVLLNDTLNTFYLRLYGVRHMVKNHSDSEKGNPLPPHRLLLLINSKVSFICTIPQTG